MSYWDQQIKAGITSSTNPYGNYTVVDTAREEMLHLIDPHWYQYPPMNPLWYGLLGFMVFTLGLLSIFGNLIVIWVFMNTKSLRTPSNLLVVNLALSDFMMMANMMPPMVYACMHGTWMLGPTYCEIYGMIGSMCGTVSITTMIFITLDRYNVIVKGVAAEPLTQKRAMSYNIFSWVATIIWCLPPFYGWNRYVPEGNMTACGTDYLGEGWKSHAYLWAYGFWCYLFPLIIVIFAYSKIVSAVFAHEKGMREQAKKMGVKSLRNEEAQKTSAECRLAKVAMVTVSLWFIAWTPYAVTNAAGMVNKSWISPLFTIWGSLFAKANAVYNPIIYAISHPKYRAALEKKLPFLACNAGNEASSSPSENSSASTEAPVTEKSESA